MALRITETSITSDTTTHAARLAPDGWCVDYLPGQTLSRNAAISAMMLAQAAAKGVKPGDRLWPDVSIWAGELELRARDAVDRAVVKDEEGAI